MTGTGRLGWGLEWNSKLRKKGEEEVSLSEIFREEEEMGR